MKIFEGYADLIIANKDRFEQVSEIPHALQTILHECCVMIPSEIPSLKILAGKLSGFFDIQNLVDSIMKRLEHYAEDLEQLVALRTHDFLEERGKVEALLTEIIPAYVYCIM